MPITEGTANEARLRTSERIKAARIAGLSTGRVMRKRVRSVVPPQTLEDSSSVISKEAMAGARMR
jgi:hypothetical protein